MGKDLIVSLLDGIESLPYWKEKLHQWVSKWTGEKSVKLVRDFWSMPDMTIATPKSYNTIKNYSFGSFKPIVVVLHLDPRESVRNLKDVDVFLSCTNVPSDLPDTSLLQYVPSTWYQNQRWFTSKSEKKTKPKWGIVYAGMTSDQARHAPNLLVDKNSFRWISTLKQKFQCEPEIMSGCLINEWPEYLVVTEPVYSNGYISREVYDLASIAPSTTTIIYTGYNTPEVKGNILYANHTTVASELFNDSKISIQLKSYDTPAEVATFWSVLMKKHHEWNAQVLDVEIATSYRLMGKFQLGLDVLNKWTTDKKIGKETLPAWEETVKCNMALNKPTDHLLTALLAASEPSGKSSLVSLWLDNYEVSKKQERKQQVGTFINLDRRSDRLANFKKSLFWSGVGQSVQFTRQSAVDARSLNSLSTIKFTPPPKNVIHDLLSKNTVKPAKLPAGAVAKFLSHVQAWKSNTNGPLLVSEDDVQWTTHSATFLPLVSELASMVDPEWDIVLLKTKDINQVPTILSNENIAYDQTYQIAPL